MKKAIIDIDGVLNYYPTPQIEYFNKCLDSNFNTLSEIKEHVGYGMYKVLKEGYRNSDHKHNAPAREHARELLQWLRDNNYLIYIITARQLFKYNQLEKTINWLNKNNLVYDYIYCTQKKDFTIFEKFGFVQFVIDDNCDNLDKIYQINSTLDESKECYYFNVINEENKNRNTQALRVTSLQSVIDILNNKQDLYY